MTEIQAEAKNIADLFFSMQDDKDVELVLNAISSSQPEAQDLAMAVINSELNSWANQKIEIVLH